MEIKFNDDKELATHIEPINKDLEYLKGATALSHIRTPLFFEHQKDAFSEILSSMASIKKEWINNASDDGLYESFSIKSFTEFESLLIKYQLFLDDDCLFVLSFILHEYDSSITNSPAARKKQLQYTLETEGMNIDEAKYESYLDLD